MCTRRSTMPLQSSPRKAKVVRMRNRYKEWSEETMEGAKESTIRYDTIPYDDREGKHEQTG